MFNSIRYIILSETEKSSENADGSIGSFSEDSNTRDSFPNSTSTRLTSTPCNSTTQESAPPTEEAITGPDDVSPAVTPQKIFYGRRGRPKRRNIYLHETPAQRQKRKLREVCSIFISSSMVRAFAHGAMGRQIDPSW